MIFHDFIILEKEKSNSILKTETENVGIVKEIGKGYHADNGEFIMNINFYRAENEEDARVHDLVGQKILFTQCMPFDINGEKILVVRGRDVIKVINDKA